MPTDRSRPSDDRRQSYRGVRFQQGRVIVERDLNAAEELAADQLRDVTLDVVGPVGSPDEGFKITPATKGKDFDFTIEAGTYYLGGVRVSLAETTTYFNQPDWITPDWLTSKDEKALIGKSWNEFVFLHVQEVEVSAREDPDLADVGLGGPDTAGRLRQLVHIERLRTDDAKDCKDAFESAKNQWKKQGFLFNGATYQLDPQGQLKVGFTKAATTTLCQPEAVGGYLHPDNQFIRVKCVKTSTSSELLWGFDNASFLYRVDGKPDGKTLKITPPPSDTTRFPKANQVVELLRSTAKLPEGGSVAEPDGFVTKLAADYKAEAETITLADSLPMGTSDTPDPLFVRIWESSVKAPANATALVAVSDPSGATGLTITVPTVDAAHGAYWTFAPRPETPQQIYPQRYSQTAQPPDGPRVWVAPLAFLQWDTKGQLSKATISDCRETFDNLVELTHRPKPTSGNGCCGITVTPEDVKLAGGLNKLFEKLRKEKQGRLHVCFRPGTYFVTEPLVLDKEFSRVALVGCPGAQWEASPDGVPDAFLDGLLVLAGCEDATVRGIHFAPPAIRMLPAFINRKVANDALTPLKQNFENARSAVAIRAINATRLTVEGCGFSFPTEAGVASFAAAVFAHGDCSGFRMIRCRSNQPREATRTAAPNAGTRGETSRNNLKQLALAIHNFTEGNTHPPKMFGELLPFTDNSAKVFVHPATGKSPPTGATLEQLAAWVNTNTDYVYLPVKDKSELVSARVLLHEKKIEGMTRLNVALGDGSVKSLDFDTARELIAKSGGQFVGVPTVPAIRAWFAVLACHQRVKTDEKNNGIYSLRPVLDDVTLADNNFVGLSVPFLGFGDIGTVTVRVNRSTDCTGGVWFTPPEYSKLMSIFPETKLAEIVIDAFPLAQIAEMPDPAARGLDYAIRVVDNHFDASPADPVQSAPTVFLAGDPPQFLAVNLAISTIPLVSVIYRQSLRLFADRQTVIISGNTLTGDPTLTLTQRSFTRMFDAIVLVLNVDGASITGNIIENFGLLGASPKAVVVFPRGGGDTPGDKVAVTGNIFRGTTNLDQLVRSNKKPSWRDYNSEI